MNPFIQRSQATWHRVGLVSEFPDLDLDKDCSRIAPSCKAFNIPKTNVGPPVEADIDLPEDLKEQVLVFKYKGKVHAIDHGTLFDIEDFGITLSAGVTCPKHGWSFDLFSGQGDRGNYKLKIWEVQLREPHTKDESSDGPDQEVWVRRKQRIG
ncbi:hypothetical protein APSETT444_001979 [Aspergillus pseudonomiae]